MKAKVKYLSILILFVLLAACQRAASTSNNETSLVTKPTTVNDEQSTTDNKRNSQNQNSITFSQNCVSTDEVTTQTQFLTQGILLYTEQAVSDNIPFLSLTKDTNEPLPVPIVGSFSVVSSEGNWLAVYDWRGNGLQIIDSTGVNIIRPWKSEWQNGLKLRWLDENWLVIPSADNPPGELTLYNPFLDQEMKLAPVLPNLYDFETPTKLDRFVLYNKQLSHVLYIGITREEGTMLILRDLEQEQELWQIESLNAFRFPAVWNVDGDYLAVAGYTGGGEMHDKSEIILIDLQGNTRQLTNFSDLFEYTSVNTLSWSPNGKYIASWVRHPQDFEDDTSYSLHLTNTDTFETIDLCIPGGVGGPLVWSPDSRQLAVESGGWMNKNGMTVLDVPSLQARKVVDVPVSLVGWTNWQSPE
jgi:hypothetical protein